MIIVRVGVNDSVLSNALDNWKLKIFKSINELVLFYFNNLDLLPPKAKLRIISIFETIIQEFHRKYFVSS